jgi:type IV pilus assembly protein PilA
MQSLIQKMRKNRKKGFTLVELIVVIAILAVLAAILVPTMTGLVSDAKEATAMANARTAYTAATAALTYLQTHDLTATVPDAAAVQTKAEEYLGDTFTGTWTCVLAGTGSDLHVDHCTWVDNGYTQAQFPTAAPVNP